MRGSLGILGGTFDPVHHGHLAIAEEARETLGLEAVLLVPASAPPHKPGRPVSPGSDRLAMLELAVAGNDALGVSRVELERPGPSYTVDTLQSLVDAAATDAARLTFILSTEALAGFPTWRAPGRILELARLAVVPRDGYATLDERWLATLLPEAAGRVDSIAGPLLAISGSAIRARVAAGRSIRYLVPDAVARYIADHDLYTGPTWRNAPS